MLLRLIILANLIELFKAYSGIYMESWEMCEGKYPLRVTATMKWKGNTQYVNMTMVFEIPYGLNQRVDVTLEYLVNNEFRKLFKIQRPACDYLSKDLGQLWFEIQKHSGMEERVCPVRPGHYHLTNYVTNYNQMNIIGLPKGKVRFNLLTIENGSRKIVNCMRFVLVSA